MYDFQAASLAASLGLPSTSKTSFGMIGASIPGSAAGAMPLVSPLSYAARGAPYWCPAPMGNERKVMHLPASVTVSAIQGQETSLLLLLVL